MKEIKAYLRRSRMDEVVHALRAIGVTSMSIISVEGIGALADPEESELSIDYVTAYSHVAKLELVCREADMRRIVGVIQKLARTGDPGDGIIFVSTIDDAIKIRTGDKGRFVRDQPREEEDTS